MSNPGTQPQPVEPRRTVLECECSEGHPAHTWLVLVLFWDGERVSRYYCPGRGEVAWGLPGIDGYM